ncbi:uncharacterized protein LOC142627787 [Castanea sativa]|uniref:uncharacterized protein LOC142627787 n=1 Tax=Castanea sativa TaxID=21020 RepID=UPI003F65407A
MDVIGPAIPKASNRHEYILEAIDYFTKLVEATSYKSVTQAVVAQFFKQNIICSYSMNGMVEASNKNIKKILVKMTDAYKDWHKFLLFALGTYHTFVRTSTGATPYSLAYGMEAVLPAEVEIRSLRILSWTKLSEDKWARS